MTHTLLSTFDDAIETTKGLGEKYIWIHCLCIIQDEVDKLNFFSKVDLIFRMALISIVQL